MCEQAFKKITRAKNFLSLFDASPHDIAAVLSHVMPNNIEKPVEFISRILLNAENLYSKVDKAALVIIFGVKRIFFQYLCGNLFALFIDSKSLVII